MSSGPTSARHGGSVAFDRAAGYYDQTRGIPAEVAEEVAHQIDRVVGTGSRVLEIGVGTGRISLPLHRRGRPMVGIDLSAPMLDRYRAKAAAERLPAASLVRADATRLPFEAGSFGGAIEVHVLHLIPGWREVVAEIHRVLVPCGVLVTARRLWDRREGRGPRSMARARHRAILMRLGMRPVPIGMHGEDDLIGALTAMGARIEELEPISWRETETWAENLEILERRVWSESWRVPEDSWQEAVRRLRAELDEEGVDLRAPILVERHVDLAAIHFS
jgi:SAM-dependent methyltransferase